jgi:hypothetical protein
VAPQERARTNHRQWPTHANQCHEQRPSWEADKQAIPRTLRNRKVHYRGHNSLLPVSITSDINPVQPTSWRPFSIIFPSTSRSKM